MASSIGSRLRSRTVRASSVVENENESIMSRWAPASDAPTMARPSRHTSTRRVQLASSWPLSWLAMTVRSSSATAMSASVSHGDLPSSAAMSPMSRPSNRRYSSSKVSSRTYAPQLPMARSWPSVVCASRSISARPAGSRSSASFSASGSAIRRSHPLRMSRMKPAAQVEAQAERVRQGQGEHLAAPLGRVVVPRELVLHEVPVLPVDLEQVPVERPVRGRGSWPP